MPAHCEMAGLPKEVRKATDRARRRRQHHQAVTKGYAIGSAGLGALVLFAPIMKTSNSSANAAKFPYFQGVLPDFSLNNPYVVVGSASAGLLPYLFGRNGHDGVGREAGASSKRCGVQFRRKARHHAGHRQAGLR